jgi:hypothetical protein
LNNFGASGVTILDLTEFDEDLKGFYGGFTDGRYGYYVPFRNGDFPFGKVARVDLNNFTVTGVTVLDLSDKDLKLEGFRGGFTDGRYGYFVPDSNMWGDNGYLARVDLQDFTTSGVAMLNLQDVDSDLTGLTGGFTDGRYGYFLKNDYTYFWSKVARVDLQDFTTASVSVTTLSPGAIYGGSFSDGRFGYFAPYVNYYAFSGLAKRIPLFFGGGSP